MAVVWRVAAGDEHAIGPVLEGFKDEGGVDSTAAHNADDSDVGGVLESADTGEVGTGVATPVTEETDDERLEFRYAFTSRSAART